MNSTGIGGFKKGQSGNPGGRPKVSGEVRALAREQTETAIRRLTDWAQSDNPLASLAASVALLDRGWGKSPRAVLEAGDQEASPGFIKART
jgi:hypothetical protein